MSSANEQLLANEALKGLYRTHFRVPREKKGRHWKHARVTGGEETQAREHGAYVRRRCRFQNHRRCVVVLLALLVAHPAHGGSLCRARLLVRVPAIGGGRAAGRQPLVAIPPPSGARAAWSA